MKNLLLLLTLSTVLLSSATARDECKQYNKVTEAYAGMLGGVVGTIYGVAISQESPSFCLPNVDDGELFNKIGDKLIQSHKEVGLMPTKASALEFLLETFPC